MISIPSEYISWSLPPANARDLSAIPDAQLLEYFTRHNGLILCGGALHVRGLVPSPSWHALFDVWTGLDALHRSFHSVQEADIPFAQDCVGDQFLLRDGEVLRLSAEIDDTEPLGLDLDSFFTLAIEDTDEFLSVGPLRQLQAQGGELKPGQLVSVMPPYVVKHDGEYSFRAIPATDRLSFLVELASQIRHLPDGQKVRFGISE